MKFLSFFILILLSSSLKALETKIEPVYGFERSYQHTPKPGRYKTEVFTGIRGTYGTEHFAGELEINQGTVSYSTGDSDSKTKTQNLLFGLRLMPFTKDWYNVFFRSGIREIGRAHV